MKDKEKIWIMIHPYELVVIVVFALQVSLQVRLWGCMGGELVYIQ